MELIDLLDPATGEPLGRTKPKPDVHRDGDWHRAAHVWIVTPDRRVLLQQRSLKKENHPGMWDVSVAGHVSAGESVIDAAIRETAEEIGLRIAEEDLEHIGTVRESHVINNGTYIDNEVHELFLVRGEFNPSALRLQPDEVDAVRLVTLPELAAMIDGGELVEHDNEYALLFAVLGSER